MGETEGLEGSCAYDEYLIKEGKCKRWKKYEPLSKKWWMKMWGDLITQRTRKGKFKKPAY